MPPRDASFGRAVSEQQDLHLAIMLGLNHSTAQRDRQESNPEGKRIESTHRRFSWFQ
jgi:hypothetical protein